MGWSLASWRSGKRNGRREAAGACERRMLVRGVGEAAASYLGRCNGGGRNAREMRRPRPNSDGRGRGGVGQRWGSEEMSRWMSERYDCRGVRRWYSSSSGQLRLS